jgi:ArsR family transcriptional regulator, virulence genes transcriptional regulator
MQLAAFADSKAFVMDAIPGFRRSAKSRTASGRRGNGSKRSELAALRRQAATAARMLKLLGNQHRLVILCFLLDKNEMKVGDLVQAVGLSQSALSQHLAMLRADRVVAFRRQSQMLHYRIADGRAARILDLLKEIYCGGMR